MVYLSDKKLFKAQFLIVLIRDGDSCYETRARSLDDVRALAKEGKQILRVIKPKDDYSPETEIPLNEILEGEKLNLENF